MVGRAFFAAVVAAVLLACHLGQRAPALDASSCDGFCMRLSEAGCPEADDTHHKDTCVATCTRVQHSGQEALPLACVLSAPHGDVAAVRTCGVRCGAR